MALFFADLVREACWDEGAGDLALAGALPGHRGFTASVPAGARFCYAIAGITHPQEWETGEGEIAGGRLVRTPISSSAGGAAVNLSAGLKTIALTVTAAWFAAQGAPAIGDVDGLAEALAGKAPASHAHDFANLTGKPTTLAGYGISDAAAGGHHHDDHYQPINAELTAVAGLATTSFGRAHLALADAAALRSHAGLGSLAQQAAGDVAISGGSISGITDLAIADGGTGASSAASARSNLGLGSIATQAASSVAITGGAVTGLASLAVSGSATITGQATANNGFQTASASDAGAGALGLDIPYSGDSFAMKRTGPGWSPLFGWLDANRNYVYSATELRIGNAAGYVGLGGPVISIGGSQVVGARRAGWTAPSGTAARTGFDTAGVSTEALAQRVKALIDDLIAHGLIGG